MELIDSNGDVARSRPTVFDNDGPTSSRDPDHLDSIAFDASSFSINPFTELPFPGE